eukprot:3658070-Amphidinium_carterae.1
MDTIGPMLRASFQLCTEFFDQALTRPERRSSASRMRYWKHAIRCQQNPGNGSEEMLWLSLALFAFGSDILHGLTTPAVPCVRPLRGNRRTDSGALTNAVH